MSESTAFSDEQQSAIIGHVLKEPGRWTLLDGYHFDKTWIIDPRVKTLVEQAFKFRKAFGRPPNAEELIAQIKATETPAQIKSSQSILDTCLKSAASQQWDVLQKKILDWAKTTIMAKRAYEFQDRFNEKKHSEAAVVFEKVHQELKALEMVDGNFDDFELSIRQLEKINADIAKGPKPTIKYGISFLDDLTGGIGQHEVHILTAMTGAGKSEIAKMVAAHNAKLGKRVHMFALEADPQEVERRILFGLFYEWYKEDHPNMIPGTLNYVEFEQGQLYKAYEPYAARAIEYYKEHFATLQTYYRVSKEFTVATLERKIMEVAPSSDLIILDHIHYVDTDGRDDNRDMHDIIKKLRDLAIHVGVPMLVIAHLRKHQGGAKEKRLLSDNDSIQGTGAITKIATAVITLGRCNEVQAIDPRAVGRPTYMQVTKYRKDGPRAQYVGLTFFDEFRRTYQPDYAIGLLEKGGTKWARLASPPYWAKHATITNTSAELSQNDGRHHRQGTPQDAKDDLEDVFEEKKGLNEFED